MLKLFHRTLRSLLGRPDEYSEKGFAQVPPNASDASSLLRSPG
jgi:hypothetical protein